MPDEEVLGLTLWTTDIAALAGFLEHTAGLTVAERHPGYASLHAGNAVIALHSDESYRGHPWYDALRKEGVARGIGAELRLRVADTQDSYRAALRLGAVAIQAPADVGGIEECQVMGPDGFLFSFWMPLE